MPNTLQYDEIMPVDLQNPFRNPTEEPDYSPDYREIVPELDMPDSSLSLFPYPGEKKRIRFFFSMICLTLLFAFLAAMTVYTGGRILVLLILKQIDLRRMGTLPENYPMIAAQYLSDSSIELALNLAAFLCGNLAAFCIGCRLTGLRIGSLFHVRTLRAAQLVMYMLAGMWLQLLAGLLSERLLPLLERVGIAQGVPSMQLGGSLMRSMILVLYAGLIAPVTEELLLRGFVLKNACRVSQRFGIFLSAFLFAVMHENLPQFLFTFPLGLLLAYITIRHNSVTPAIFVHMTVNLTELALQLVKLLLENDIYQRVYIGYMLSVLLLGTIAFFFLLLTERLPEQTPHQSIRVRRLALTSPLFWILLLAHAGAAWFTMYWKG